MADDYDDADVDWEMKCSKCGGQVTDVLSAVCYDCRQKMVLVDAQEYEELKAKLEAVRSLLREIVGSPTCSIGSCNNVYYAQLNRREVDELYNQVEKED